MRRGLGQLALGFGLICSVAGCGGAPPLETLVPVAGSLMVNGKPLDGVTVTFIPEIAKNNRGGSGTTGVDGSFKVTDLTQNLPGLAVGKYTVAYSRMRLPNGSAPPKRASLSILGLYESKLFPRICKVRIRDRRAARSMFLRPATRLCNFRSGQSSLPC